MRLQSNDHDLHPDIWRTGYELQHKLDANLKKVDLHHHDFYEIFFLLSGEVTCTIESRLYRVVPGDVLFISPKELHKLHISTGREDYERYILWLNPRTARKLSTEKTDLLRCMEPGESDHHNQLHIPPEEQPLLYGLLVRLYQELHAETYGEDLMAESLLIQLLVDINRLAAHQELNDADPALSNPVISQVVEYIGAHYGDQITLEELAERHYVSKYHLSHEFSRLVGTSVHRYILKKRLLIARQMLSQGKRPNEVWEPCGFGDYTGFYRAFQGEYGVSPREYANAIRTIT